MKKEEFEDAVKFVKENISLQEVNKRIIYIGSFFKPQNIKNLQINTFFAYYHDFLYFFKKRLGLLKSPSYPDNPEILKEAFELLLDESIPIIDRINKVTKQYLLDLDTVKLILAMIYPDRYGFYNDMSLKGLSMIGENPADKDPNSWNKLTPGEQFSRVNNELVTLSKKYNVELWDLFWVWYLLLLPYNPDAFLLSFGFDLLGPTEKIFEKENKGVKFGDLFQVVEDTIQSSNNQSEKIRLIKMPSEYNLKDANGTPKNVKLYGEGQLIPYPPFYDKDTVEGRIREYFFDDESADKNKFDEILIRLFSNKEQYITGKEREGFLHIKAIDTDLTIYFASSEEDKENPMNPIPEHPLLDISKSPPLYKEDITQKVDLIPLEVKFRSYFFVKLHRSSKIQKKKKNGSQKLLDNEARNNLKVDRVAVMVSLFEPKPLKFFRLSPYFDYVYVDVDELAGLQKTDEKKSNQLGLWFKDDSGKTFFDSNVENSPYVIEVKVNGKKRRLLSLYNLLLAIAWAKLIWKSRKNLGYLKKKDGEKYMDFKRFEQALVEKKEYLSFMSKITVIDFPKEIKTFMGKTEKHYDDWHRMHLIMDWMQLSTTVGRTVFPSHGTEWRFHSLTGTSMEWRFDGVTGSKLFASDKSIMTTTGDSITVIKDNVMLTLLDDEFYKENNFRNNILDFAERGHQWLISWYMMLSSMLCYTAQTFIIYDELFNRHVEEGKGTHDLAELTHQAYADFSEYYDQGIISYMKFRSDYEFAKKAMHLDEMYDTIIKRLNLYSSYTIAEENSNIGIYALGISVAVVLATIFLTLIPYLGLLKGWSIYGGIVLPLVLYIMYARKGLRKSSKT